MKASTVEAEHEENPVQEKGQKSHCAGNRDSKNKQQKAHTAQSQTPETTGSGRKSSLLWLEGHMANKILISLQTLVSCFLKPSANRQAVVGALVCPKGSTVCGALVAVAQAGEGFSVLNFLCAKDQANENYEYRSGI